MNWSTTIIFPIILTPAVWQKTNQLLLLLPETQLNSTRVESNWKPIGISITHQSGTFLWCRSQGEANDHDHVAGFLAFLSVFFSLFFASPLLLSRDSFLKNEIFIGRLSFRYISWIVINFIDNCHILMAWLCAWLSDCYCFVWFALYVRGICTAKIFLIFLLIFPWPPPPSASRALRNCFRRKLLHEPQARPGPGGGDISMGNMLPANICRSVLITHI